MVCETALNRSAGALVGRNTPNRRLDGTAAVKATANTFNSALDGTVNGGYLDYGVFIGASWLWRHFVSCIITDGCGYFSSGLQLLHYYDWCDYKSLLCCICLRSDALPSNIACSKKSVRIARLCVRWRAALSISRCF